MAIRNVLHMSQLKAFEAFLESKGYMIIPTVGAYEVLRAQKPKKARKPKESPVIVYRKGGAKEFTGWANARACDGRWSMLDAMNSISVISMVYEVKPLFFRGRVREALWRKLRDQY